MSLLSQALYSAQSPDNNVRSTAKETLDEMSRSDPVNYLVQLSLELAKNSSPASVRQLAGILIKNLVNNANKNPAHEGIWLSVDPQIKAQVRNNALGTLASEEKEVRLASSQAVAALALLDLPRGEWTEILRILITNAKNVNPIFKVSAIRTLGYICEGLNPEFVPKDQSNEILTALALSLDASVRDLEIKMVALNAFRNSVKFINANIVNQAERNIILNLMYGCCADPKIEIRQLSMMIICDILATYYDYLDTNLMDLGNLTYNLIRNDVNSVAIYAIEFWNQAADYEYDRIRLGDKPSKGYINIAATSLVPLLLEKINIIDENDNDEWNIHKACASTLAAVSLIIKDSVLELVGTYIAQEIKSSIWQNRLSAVAIIGSVVEGLQNIEQLAAYTFQDLLNLLKDSKSIIAETAAWSISKSCEFHSEFLVSHNYFFPIMTEIGKCLEKSPKIATHSCWTVVSLFSRGICNSLINEDYVNRLLDSLIATSMRVDAYSTDQDILMATYSAINKIMEEVPDNILATIIPKTSFFLNILEQSLKNSNLVAAQPHVFSSLHTIFGRASTSMLSEDVADHFVKTVIEIFKSRGNIVEEGLQAIGTLSENIGLKFSKYLQAVMPFVEWSVNSEISSVAKSGVMAVGDFARALNEKFDGYIPIVINKLLLILSNDQINFDVKIRTIETLGDLASHCSKEFSRYLPEVFNYIDGAAGLSLNMDIDPTNIELHEYLAELRESIIGFYVGIIQGLTGTGTAELLVGNLQKITDYAQAVVLDQYKPSLTTHISVIGMLGDIAATYLNRATPYLKTPKITSYIAMQSNTTDKSLKDVVQYAQERIQVI